MGRGSTCFSGGTTPLPPPCPALLRVLPLVSGWQGEEVASWGSQYAHPPGTHAFPLVSLMCAPVTVCPLEASPKGQIR